MIESYRDRITQALKGHKADYLEVRLEEAERSHIQYRGRELEELGRSTSMGGSVRALVKGGWGFACFNELSGLREKVDMATHQATLVGRETSDLARTEPVVDSVPAVLGKDPTAIPLSTKKALMDEYNDIMWSVSGLQTSTLGYGDSRRTVIFASSEGSYIEQSRVDCIMRLTAVARKDGDVQQASVSTGSLGDYSPMEKLHDEVRETAQRAVALLSAPHIQGGEYTVVLDPVLAGVFVHEAFGHLSESDFLYENQQMRDIMVLGRRFGGRHLNIVDGAAVPGLRGSYKYDDEGVPARKTYLIREGVLTGRLHSRETAGKMKEEPTGNARAISYQFPPIVRMTNTLIEPGTASFQDLVGDIQDGVYAKNWYGGTTSMEMFTFSAGEAYRIRNGRVAEMVRPVVLSGNVFATLEHLDALANDLDMNQGGGCGKGNQFPLPVSNGSPHIRIQRCLVGGR